MAGESQQRLEGRLALITGAARGLGEAIARRFVGEGASVLLNDLDETTLETTARDLGGEALPCDVSDPDAVRRMFGDIGTRHGKLDILVNNAGISGLEERPDRVEALTSKADGAEPHLDITVSLTDEEWRRMIAVHLDGTFYCCREALALMGPRMSGVIINMGSIMGSAGGAGAAPYSAAKAGVMGLTRALAREVVTRNIRVNAIAPGWIDTAMTEALAPLRPRIERQIPMGRYGEPDDIAWAAVYLASDEARYLTGQVLSPNGGWYMSQ